MAFNLPPPWDPGYALPENVIDEGLERRGFVTKWMPRGTYDAPDVGTGGYVVPGYVMREGYGQGTFTTKWEPANYYDGPRVPHWLNKRPTVTADRRTGPGAQRVTFRRAAALGDDSDGGHPLFTEFGRRAADQVLARVAMLPPSQRKQALRTILDAIDPSLYGRANTYTQDLVRSGVRGPDAVRAALARAMSVGISTEIVNLGKTRTPPRSRSLLGLGRTSALVGTIAVNVPSAITATGIAVKSTTCAGYSWVTDHWERTRAGSVDMAGPAGIACPAAGGTPGGVSGDVSKVTVPAAFKRVAIGPWLFPLDGGTVGVHLASIPPAWVSFIASEADRVTGSPAMKALLSRDQLKVLIATGGQPLFRAKHPIKGEDWAVYIKAPIDPSDGKGLVAWLAHPTSDFSVTWKKIPPRSSGVLGSVGDAIASAINTLVATVVDVVTDVVDAIGDLACKVLNDPNAIAAGAAAGGGAGAAGVGIAQTTACKPPEAPPQEMPAAGSSSMLPLAIAGGAALVAVLILSTKKKAHP